MNQIRKKIYPALAALLCSVAAGVAMESDLQISSLRSAPSENARKNVVSPKKFPGSNTTLCGAMVYNDLWSLTDNDGNFLYPMDAGIYTIQAREGGKVSRQQNISAFSSMKSGLYRNGVYYVFTMEGQDSGIYLSEYSTSTWNRSKHQEIDYVNFPCDLTYDPVTKKIYGFFYNDDTQEFDRFCSFSTSYGEATQIGREMDRCCFAIAANKDGEIYGIWGYVGWLIKVNPKTGAYEQIGRLGVAPGEIEKGYVHSMTFDDATGRLYWASNDDKGNSALYEINTSTGAATKVMDFENNATFAGIYALPFTVSGDAPAAVTDIETSFTSIDNPEATISFTMPSLTVNGEPLTGTLGALVEIAGNEVDVENLSAGAVATCTVTLPEGESVGTITPYTVTDAGEAVEFTVWAGEDIPASPANLTLSDHNGIPNLTWEAPAKGAHGGLYDIASLRYRVVRNSDKKEMARDLSETSWQDIEFTGTAALSYSVYAYTSKGESEAAVSDKLIIGEGWTIPFTCGFDSADDFELWTVVDLNGNSKWEYDKSKKYIYSKYDDKDAANDWIFSPKFKAEAGKVYQLALDASVAQNSNPKYAEDFQVWLATSVSPDSKAVEIMNVTGYLQKTANTLKAFFRAPADGWYHLGIYTNSSKDHWQLNIDNVGVTEIDSHVPSAITDLTVTPADKGELSAILSFKMPETDTEERPLTEKMSVAVYVGTENAPAYKAEELEPGAEVSWTHTPERSGKYAYRVVASTPAGDGEEKSVETFVGTDIPGAPADLKADEQPSGEVILSWIAPEKGANGGWFDPSTITYRIVRSDGEVLSTDCRETTFTDSSLKLSRQDLYYYLVTPYSGDVKGAYANTDYELYGPAYPAPLAETFPGADMKWYPWVSESDGPVHVWCLETAGANPATPDQNGDGGLAMFVSDESNKGITGSFTSPKVDISALDTPELSFRMYHSVAPESVNESIDVYILPQGGEKIKLNDYPLYRDDNSSGWQRHAFSLEGLPSDVVRVRFVGKTLGAGNIHIDNISFDNAREIDLEISSLSAPSRVATDVAFPFSAQITNSGNAEISDLKLNMLVDDEPITSFTLEPLAAGESRKVELQHRFAKTGKYDFALAVEREGDSDLSNNRVSKPVEVVAPVVPTLDGLTGSCPDNTNVILEWLPLYGRGAVTDDVESYTDWAIDGIGDWVTVDLDRDVTYNIKKDLETYPYQNDPKAWQVCNAETLGINIWPQGTPKSGDRMLMAMANINVANDDWLISPLLNGEQQTVSFYAKAFTNEGVNEEKMVVYYSTGSLDPADFIKVSAGESITVADSWYEYTFQVPRGARRFAVRCISSDAFALFIDDLRFNDLTVPSVEVAGYDIYRNDEKIGETAETRYEDNLHEAGLTSADYHVVARYSDGSSAKSDTFTIRTSGLNDLGHGIKVNATKGKVVISGAEGLSVSVNAPDGMNMEYISAADPTETIYLSPGVYLISVGTKTSKVIVR